MKTSIYLACLIGAVTASNAVADTLGFAVGSEQWKADYSGTLSSDSGALQGSQIDIENDLGFSDDSHKILWAKFEHPIPLLPNLRIAKSDLSSSATSTLSRELIFNGETYSASEQTASEFDLSNTEYTLYYELLDNWLNLDMGITLRKYDGLVSLTTSPSGSNLNEQETLDMSLPLVFAAARADLPFTGFFVDAELNIISYDGDSLADTAFGVGYESDFGLGAKAGYRKMALDVTDDSFTGDLEFDGSYINIFYHF